MTVKVNEPSIREGRELGKLYPFSHKGQCSVEALGRFGPFYCTRPPNHDGPHVAHGTDGAVASWKSD